MADIVTRHLGVLTNYRNCFKSDKIAEISYASKLQNQRRKIQMTYRREAIQGKDCLVQKFRNSSVMLEAPHYRPKVRIWYWALIVS